MRTETNHGKPRARNNKVEWKRRYPIGAEVIGANETHFRLWAPKAKSVDLVLEESLEQDAKPVFQPLLREDGGYFSGRANVGAGALYRFRVNNADQYYPDPASRFQPNGPHGSSCVVDPAQFQWTDQNWGGLNLIGQIIYEFHVGTFTEEGTWRAAAEKLPLLKEDGITLLEMMPIADFPGAFGWGYDGVNMFAPCRLYGEPDDLRFFIDRAHSLGLGVILDVVYNHFGPDGNYLGAFSDYYMSGQKNEWGECINFDGENSGPVREFFITNGSYWIDEYHFDGFRFDAVQGIRDKSEEYIIGAVGRAARRAAGERAVVLIAENERQQTKMVRPRAEGGDDLDGMWNDDWHHTAVVALTGVREAYYTDYCGSPQEFVSAAKYGFLFQGQPYIWQEAERGYPSFGVRPEAFVSFIENHDQVANTAFGERVRFLTSPARYRAIVGLLLLGPWTPLLFQGQEFGAAAAFRYFSDVGDEKLKEAVRKGRFEFLSQFPSVASPEVQERLPVPSHRSTFEGSKLDWDDRKRNPQLWALHRDLIHLRHNDVRFRELKSHGVDGAVLGTDSFVLRYFADAPHEERLLVVNLGGLQSFTPAPEPLLAPPDRHEWQTMWTSEGAKYGGLGQRAIVHERGWTLFAEETVALRAVPTNKERKTPKQR
ncbi:MAG TPA: malto-oligosyltrehalose trehalohydrolase [Chthoniobacterales bacterium]|nr:malto-oligosyltrehalose trehalohydrolase [Chthoniobacterales bacterium]